MPPTISIITPVYNGAPYLDELIQSVLAQDYPALEHIIIDDGSTDNGATAAVLQRYPHLRWWSRPNRGQYATMNEGLRAAAGDVVSFISADDRYVKPDAFSAVMGFWEAHPLARVVYGARLDMDEQGLRLPVQTLVRRAPLWLYGVTGFVAHCSLFASRAFLLEHNLFFDETLRYNGDLDWILRLISIHNQTGRRAMVFFDRDLSLVRHHGGQATRQFVERIQTERRIVLARHGIPRPVYLAARVGLRWGARVQKAVYWLRTGGPAGLWQAYLGWKKK